MSHPEKSYNVLFLCTGNSARSILAEAYLNRRGAGRLHAFSAGSHPGGSVNPYTLEILNAAPLPVANLRSRSWDEFAAPGATHMDFIFTVCDDAAGEVCPVWPGRPVSAHWPFVSLPLRTLDRMALERKVAALGNSAWSQLARGSAEK